jgi:hypothetical protein
MESAFVADLDREKVVTARRRALRFMRISAWLEAVAGAFFVVIAALLAVKLARQEITWELHWLMLMGSLSSGPVLCISSWRRLAAARSLDKTWSTIGVPRMRCT